MQETCHVLHDRLSIDSAYLLIVNDQTMIHSLIDHEYEYL